MARRIDRLIESVPGAPETAGALDILGGAAGMGLALTLANLPLAIGAFGLWVAGFLGPALRAMARKANPLEPAPSASPEADEDAAVEAYVRHMETVERFQAMMAASEERPPRSRMH